MRKGGVFITGTDTGVGKTIVSTGLATLFRKSGIDVGVMKPVETGCRSRGGLRVGTDSRLLMFSAGSCDELDLVAPYRLKAPLAPAVAADQEGISINLQKIVKCYKQLASRHKVLIVEGVGGLMVPLSKQDTVLDLAQNLKLPVIIVAANRLGAINHTLLTFHQAVSSGLRVEGIILNQTQKRYDEAAKTNGPLLESLTGVPILASIPYLGKIDLRRKISGGMLRLLNHLDKGVNNLRIKLDA